MTAGDPVEQSRGPAPGTPVPRPAWEGVVCCGAGPLGLWERLYLPAALQGIALTARIALRNLRTWLLWLPAFLRGRGAEAPRGAATVFYPDEIRPDFSPINRGKHVLTLRPGGEPQCVACFLCATACPSFCIHIVAGSHPDPSIEKYPVRFDIEIDKCVFCGFCEEACPVDAIRLAPDVRLADWRRERMVYDKEYLTTWNPTFVREEHVYPGGRPRE